MNNLAVCHYNGEGVDKGLAAAVSLYRQAVEVGHAQAMYNLAVCYENGDGVGRSSAQAIAWYRKAAGGGEERAIEALRRLGA
jgi:TPR repeat protein